MEKISGDDTMMCGCEARQPAARSKRPGLLADVDTSSTSERSRPLELASRASLTTHGKSTFDDDVNGKMYCVEKRAFFISKTLQ